MTIIYVGGNAQYNITCRYPAGSYERRYYDDMRAHAPHKLISFAINAFDRDVAACRGDKLIADSGAYSAHNLGDFIDIHSYAARLLAYRDTLEWGINLDVIGDAQKSRDNLHRLRDLGLTVIPVIHGNATAAEFDVAMRDVTDRVCLGGMVGMRKGQQQRVLDSTWARLVRADGSPYYKVHGLGVTTPDLTSRYPWASVDSASWLFTSSSFQASFYIDRRMVNVGFGDKHNGPYHYKSLGAHEREEVERQIAAAGYTLDDCVRSYYPRRVICALSLIALGADVPDKFTHDQGGLFV